MADELYMNPFQADNKRNKFVYGDISQYSDDELLGALRWYSYPDWNCWYSYVTFDVQIENCLDVNNDRYHTYQDILDELEQRDYDIADYENPHQYIALAEFLQIISPIRTLSQTTSSSPSEPLSPFEKAYLDAFLKKEANALRELGLMDN